MKFLCDNCKSKYQIADDKVSGKTVRMKCRKCGHLIEIRASVTETSVATGMHAQAVPSERPPPVAPARPGAPARPAPRAPVKPVARPAPAVATPTPPGALAGAFSKAVVESVPEPSPSTAPLDEWHVGVNGVPVGPIPLNQVRSKIQAGAVTEDSLAWREGLEEWAPVRSIPELAQLVRDVREARRESLAPPASLPAAPAASAPALADPFGLSAPSPAPVVEVAQPLGSPVLGTPPVTDDISPDRDRRRGGVPLSAWAVVVLALATGLIAGWAFFSKAPPPPTVQIVTVNAPVAIAPPPPNMGEEAAHPDAKADPSAAVKPGTPRTTGGGVAVAAATTAAPKDVPNIPAIGVPDVPAVPGVGGPTPGGPVAGGGGQEQLNAADIQRVVSNGRNALKRACWEPALAAKPPSAPGSARVTVAITIGRDGRVLKATPSGGEVFPTLGSCIAGRVRSWVFPSASGETQTSAVFNFVAQ